MSAGVIASFPAREVVVAVLGTIYAVGAETDEQTLAGQLTAARHADGSPVFTLPMVFGLLLFYAWCLQCAATLAVIRRETNSWRWPIFAWSYMTALGYGGALLIYQLGTRVTRLPPTALEAWRELERETVANCRVFEVERSVAVSPVDGKPRTFHRIQSVNWAQIVPVTADQEVVLVRQYRHGDQRVTLEIPGGLIDPGEDPATAALRECLEETGYRARAALSLGVVAPNPRDSCAIACTLLRRRRRARAGRCRTPGPKSPRSCSCPSRSSKTCCWPARSITRSWPARCGVILRLHVPR